MSSHSSRVMAGLVPAIHALLPPPYHPPRAGEGREGGVDAREDGVPAACRGGVSLRGHDADAVQRSEIITSEAFP
jgi:hypothetical protein